LFAIAAAAGFLAVGGGLLAAWTVAAPWWADRESEARSLLQAHLEHEVSHPGWSFPGTLWSDAAPIDLPRPRLVAQAKARGYRTVCPPVEPGDICPKTGDVILRGGMFPEGPQPAGNIGWSRPLALEPVPLSWLIGPDAEIREHLPLAEAPPHLVAALLASEDEHFRDHGGVDFAATARAAIANFQGGGYQQGGSTITMQLVRNLDQRKERTVERKLREMALAWHVDAALGKDGVLENYLDTPYLGQDGSFSICGFRAAAKYYFGKDAVDLDLAESALLVGILPAPGRFAPDRNPKLALQQRNRVLRRMAETGWNADEVEQALQTPVAVTTHSLIPGQKHPAFVQATRDFLERTVGPSVAYGAGLQVWTSADLVAQQASERVLSERPAMFEGVLGRRSDGPLTAAGAVIDPETGRLVAVYGGPMVLDTDLNRATQSRRQPGSSAKPLAYLLGLSQRDEAGNLRYTSATPLDNSWRTFEKANGWRPKNVAGEYQTRVSLAYGIAWSQNVATVDLMERAGGPVPLKAMSAGMGIDVSGWPDEYGISIGQAEATPLEMAIMAATITNGGRRVDASPVVIAKDRTGRVRYSHGGLGEQVVDRDAAALVRELMGLSAHHGTGGGIFGANGEPGIQGPAIGKTGTTDEEKDLWFVGSTAWYSAAVWLGYDQPARIGAPASDLGGPLWGWWLRAVSEGLPKKVFPEIVPIERGYICNDTGHLAIAGCRALPAPFLPGTRPKVSCAGGHPVDPPKDMQYVGLWRRVQGEKLGIDPKTLPPHGAWVPPEAMPTPGAAPAPAGGVAPPPAPIDGRAPPP
jgi:membrane peptidoglycan carboxypeptidase